LYSTIDTSICNNEIFIFNEEQLSENGIYEATFSSVNKCDSIVTLNLTVISSSDTILNYQICEGDSVCLDESCFYEPGIYELKLINQIGCDSIITLKLDVLYNSITEINKSICEGDNYNGWTESGIYKEVFDAANGCDSIRTTNLNVFPLIVTEIFVQVCQGEQYNGWNESGIYLDTLISAFGCDSIIKTHLTIVPYFNILEHVGICEGDDYLGRTETDTFTRELISQQGCDSIVTTYLTVHNSSEIFETVSICQGESYHGYQWTGTWIRPLKDMYGCDSIVTTELEVISVPYTTLHKEICFGESFMGYSEPGTYVEMRTASSGCDSIVTINLSVNARKPEVVNIGDTLKCIDSYPSYQWYYEENIIMGATDSFYIVSQSGSYLLQISEKGCSTNSEKMFVVPVNKIRSLSAFKYSIIPNPNTGKFIFRIDSGDLFDLEIKLINSIGQVIENRNLKSIGINHTEEFDVRHLSKGIYYLKIFNNEYSNTKKIIVN
ncbi:MAG: T9SS type A sorting domain-containing protein, partial [Mariniphaga sp.]|nr:T9SS type A sorting domain-containing protein [Mariniphaga sp.]